MAKKAPPTTGSPDDNPKDVEKRLSDVSKGLEDAAADLQALVESLAKAYGPTAPQAFPKPPEPSVIDPEDVEPSVPAPPSPKKED